MTAQQAKCAAPHRTFPDSTITLRFAGRAALFAVVLGAAAPVCAHGVTERVSVGQGGVQANAASLLPAISADGNVIVFVSAASNLVPGDTNRQFDVFVHDRASRTTTRVNLGPGGIQTASDILDATISADGRFVAFTSDATNLVTGDTNGLPDTFVHDRRTGITRRVNVGPDGVQADGHSFGRPGISADGRFVAFASSAANLVVGDTNVTPDIFVRDRRADTTQRVSLGPDGAEADQGSNGPSLSADGRFVAFESRAENLVPGDTSLFGDIYVRDRKAGTIRRIDAGPAGVEGDRRSSNAAISANGRVVAFASDATNLLPADTNNVSDVFVVNRRSNVTRRVSVGPGGVQTSQPSDAPAISGDGRFVAFESYALLLGSDLRNVWRDVFLRDRQTGTLRQISLGPRGVEGDGESYEPAISADGQVVAFTSRATNLVPGDSNGWGDVFVRILTP